MQWVYIRVRKKTRFFSMIFWIILAFVFFVAVTGEELPFVIEDEFRSVTCGAAIKLAHHDSGFRLHSHAVKYGSGSGQQSVTAFPEGDDSNSYFKVLGPFGKEDCRRGEPVACGATLRLFHVNTQKYLHSHAGHAAPLSGSQEVSAYEKTDAGDNWKVECVRSGDKTWARERPVRLREYFPTYDA
jgi:dolichyl-phosphate-mannose--protein O-mannosyl transferase